jgi:hypothetical protein
MVDSWPVLGRPPTRTTMITTPFGSRERLLPLVVVLAGLFSSLIPSRLQGISPIGGNVPTYAQLSTTGETTWAPFMNRHGVVDGVKAVVLKEARFRTEVGPILVIYVRIGEVGNPEEVVHDALGTLGLNSLDGDDTIGIVVVDSIEHEVDRTISKGMAKPRRHQSKFERQMAREFAGMNRDDIVSAVMNGTTYHELDHAIRTLSGEDAHTESLADLRAISQGDAQQFFLEHLLALRGEYSFLLRLGRKLGVRYPMKGGKYHSRWIRKSGILNVPPEELRALAASVYDDVREASRAPGAPKRSEPWREPGAILAPRL